MGGLRPIVAVYSTFMTRAVDQVMYDVGLHSCPSCSASIVPVSPATMGHRTDGVLELGVGSPRCRA